MPGYCIDCKHGPLACERRQDIGARPEFVEGIGEYYDCRTWEQVKEVVVEIRCSWCSSLIAWDVWDASPDLLQQQKIRGRIVSHGICPSCREELERKEAA